MLKLKCDGRIICILQNETFSAQRVYAYLSIPVQTNKPKRIAKLLAAMEAAYFRLRLRWSIIDLNDGDT